jgi:hypothetical protein
MHAQRARMASEFCSTFDEAFSSPIPRKTTNEASFDFSRLVLQTSKLHHAGCFYRKNLSKEEFCTFEREYALQRQNS